MNVVDFGILVVIGTFAVAGLQRGFLLGLADLVTFGCAIVVGAKLADVIATPLRDRGFPLSLAAAAGFLAAAVVGYTVIGLAIKVLLAPFGKVTTGTPLGWANSILGLLPGTIRGFAIAAVLMVLLASLPPELGLRVPLDASRLADPIIRAGRQALDGGLQWAGVDPASLGLPRITPIPVRGVVP